MKRGMFLAMIGLLLVGWLSTVQNLVQIPSEFNRLVAEAQDYEEKELYVRAIESYKNALEYDPDSVEIQLSVAEAYLAIGDESAFINRCNSINESQGYPLSVVEPLADFYIENNRNERAIDLLQKAMKTHKNEQELLERYEKVRYSYQNLYVSADEIGQMINGSCAFKLEDRYGLMTSKGSIRIRSSNDWCGPYSSDGLLAPIQKDGEFYFADKNGYRYEIAPEGEQVEALGILTDNVAPARINGYYGYIDSRFSHLTEFIWDDATQIQCDLGAVKQGEKWALINSKYELLSEYVYDDVKTDENGFFCVNSRAFVKQGDLYWMVNEKGEMVGDGCFEDAVPFVGEQPTAAKSDGKWGFVDEDGKWVIEPQYLGAGAFSNSLAPVETTAGWGYINLENQLVIEAQYLGAKSFYEGIAPVKNGNQWSLIELNVK